MTRIDLLKFWSTTPDTHAFDEWGHCVISPDERWELHHEKQNNGIIVVGLVFEDTTFCLSTTADEERLGDTMLRVLADGMRQLIATTWNATDRYKYLEQLFDLVRQVNRSYNKSMELDAMLEKIVDKESGYTFADKFSKGVCFLGGVPLYTFTDGKMTFHCMLDHTNRQVSFSTDIRVDDQSLSFSKSFGWDEHYQEGLELGLEKFRANGRKLGWIA